MVLGPDNSLISADYPGYVMGKIEEGTGSICLFTNGACGDINPLTETLRRRMRMGEDVYDRTGGSFDEARMLGETIAQEALDALRHTEFRESGFLRCASHLLELPVHPPAPRDQIAARVVGLQDRLRRLADSGAAPDELYRNGLELSFGRRVLESVDRGMIRLELQGIRIDDLVLVGIPGEVFVEIGLEIKSMAEAEGLKAIIVELANDYMGYMPTERAFDEGGYETAIAQTLGFGPNLEAALLEGARQMLCELSS